MKVASLVAAKAHRTLTIFALAPAMFVFSCTAKVQINNSDKCSGSDTSDSSCSNASGASGDYALKLADLAETTINQTNEASFAISGTCSGATAVESVWILKDSTRDYKFETPCKEGLFSAQLDLSAMLDGVYSVNARLKDVTGPNDQSTPAVSVSKDTLSPDIPGAIVDRSDLGGGIIAFEWSASSDSNNGTVTYELQIGSANELSDILSKNVGAALSFSAAGNVGVANYARVRALDAAGNTSEWNTTAIIPTPHSIAWGATVAAETVIEDGSMSIALSPVSNRGSALTLAIAGSGTTCNSGQWTTPFSLSGSDLVGVPGASAVGSCVIRVTATATDATVGTRDIALTIQHLNHGSTAVNDSGLLAESSSLLVDVTANDTDPDAGDTLTVSSVSTPTNGTATISSNQVLYTPTAAWTGTDSFSYTITDSGGATDTATVSVVVYPALTPYTWSGGGGDNLWSTGANWYGGTAPVSGQEAVFSAYCQSNCSPSITANITVGGIYLHSTYSGTVTQSGASTITISSGGRIRVEAGSFVGGSGAITLSPGVFQVTGGSFTSTSGTLTLGSSSTTFHVAQSSGFVHNNGTVSIAQSGGYQVTTIDAPNGIDFYDFKYAGVQGNCCNGSFLAVGSGQIPNIVHSFTRQSRGSVQGNWTLQGDYISNTSYDAGGIASDSGILTLNGTGTQQIQNLTPTSLKSGMHLVINKASGQVVAEASTTVMRFRTLRIVAGTFIAPSGTLYLDTREGTRGSIFYAEDGTTFTHNSGTVAAYVGAVSNSALIRLPSGQKFYNLSLSGANGNCCNHGYPSTVSGQPVTVEGTYTMYSGRNTGNYIVEGNVTLEANGQQDNAVITMSGSNNQTLNQTAAAFARGVFTINKTGGQVTLVSALSKAAGNFVVQSGTLDMAGFNLTVSGAQLQLQSTGTIIRNGGVLNPDPPTVNLGSLQP